LREGVLETQEVRVLAQYVQRVLAQAAGTAQRPPPPQTRQNGSTDSNAKQNNDDSDEVERLTATK
jgi:hypothetical protein